MARMGGSKHLRSYSAPDFWPISTKERFWAIKPSPGPHSLSSSIPLGIVLRDYLKYARTKREVIRALSMGLVKVDGKVRKDYKYPVGAMDVIEIVPSSLFFRAVPNMDKFISFVEIPKEEASIKPLRIENKTTVNHGHIQLNLFDGSNILIKVSDPKNPTEVPYRTLSTVIVKIPEREIIDYIPLEEGVYAIIFGGKNTGIMGKVKEIRKGMKRYRSLVVIETDDGSIAQTSLDYVLAIGREKPIIKLM